MNWDIILVGLGGAIIGGILSLLGVHRKGQIEIRKLHLANQQNWIKSYIDNARTKLDELYIPLYKHLTLLEDKYTQLRDLIAIHGKEMGEVGTAGFNAFKDSHDAFCRDFDLWQTSGMTAFLIYDLEEKCRLLRNFITNSFNSTELHVQRDVYVTISGPLSLPQFRLPLSSNVNFISQTQTQSKVAVQEKSIVVNYGIGFLPFGFRTELTLKKQFIAAPISSTDFDKQFMEYVSFIKVKVREVTLGKL